MNYSPIKGDNELTCPQFKYNSGACRILLALDTQKCYRYPYYWFLTGTGMLGKSEHMSEEEEEFRRPLVAD